jgi:hypothetical protein
MRKLLPFLCLVLLPLFYATDLDKELEKFMNWKEKETIIKYFSHIRPPDEEFYVKPIDNKIGSIEKEMILQPHHRMKVIKVEKMENEELKITVQIWEPVTQPEPTQTQSV